MFSIRYDVRIIEDGKLVTRKRFAVKDAAFNWAKDRLSPGRRSVLRARRVHDLVVKPRSAWVTDSHSWQHAAGPLSTVFLHHAVTKHLPESATEDEERAQMRLLDQIAHGRGFNGISYSWVVFPSGRVWQGRGWLAIEAATEGFNTTSDSICFAGNLSSFKPSEASLVSARKLIERGQAAGKLAKTGLRLRGHREVSQTSCPGDNLTAGMIATMQRAVNA